MDIAKHAGQQGDIDKIRAGIQNASIMVRLTLLKIMMISKKFQARLL